MKSLLATLHHEPDYKVTIPELLLHGSDDNLGNIRKIMPQVAVEGDLYLTDLEVWSKIRMALRCFLWLT